MASAPPLFDLEHPVVVVGAGPVGLTTALGLAHHGIPFILLERNETLTPESKAGTVLTRTLEIWDRYGCADDVLATALRIDEIAEIERATNLPRQSVRLDTLAGETRFPFVINIPQHDLEPILARALEATGLGSLRTGYDLTGFQIQDDHVLCQVNTPAGPTELAASHLLACDGGRSTVRRRLGYEVSGRTMDDQYMLVDVEVDLDVAHRRDYPYLAYFADPDEWLVLVRFPTCWRFVYRLPPGGSAPGPEELVARARRFIGDVEDVSLKAAVAYPVHHRVAGHWSAEGRVFLMGDAAHLITPMWALGVNTGILDAGSLPWRLAWVLRGWAEPELLDGYEREQRPVAVHGSGEMAEAARRMMAHEDGRNGFPTTPWALAYTRSLLGVRLDVEGSGDWSMVMAQPERPPVRPGDRLPNLQLRGQHGLVWLHDLTRDCFAALWLTDIRGRPPIPAEAAPGIAHGAISRWDAPIDSGLRDRTLFDAGAQLARRLGIDDEAVVLVRPDHHVAAILPAEESAVEEAYAAITCRQPVAQPLQRVAQPVA